MKIKAAVTYEANAPFVIEEVDLAEPKDNEVLVKVVASGICHTDEVARSQMIPVPLPAVLGHEGCGIVEKTGKNVTDLKPGDRVGFSYAYCGKCDCCLQGMPFACDDFNLINFGGIMPDHTTRLSKNGKPISTFFGQSSFATYAVVDEKNVVKVPYDDIDLAYVGPLGCGIQTGAGTVLNYLKPGFGTSIAVFGCGTVGMSAIMAAKIANCSQIIAVGGNLKSLELAKELGATHTINRRECPDIVGEIKKITGRGAHYSVETSGAEAFILAALRCLRFKGIEAIVGVAGDVTVNVQGDIMGEAKTVTGVIEGESVAKIFIPQLLDYYRRGMFPFDRLVKFYPFEQINKAVEDSHKGGCIKAILRMD
ncbi:MAG: NAD(P)-dependent alcohol dehydrogenase [Fusicatenibacter sp.]|nr:NAD(P)-dependent alcohol dehydrogenase [Fusicatenibacter sp.]